MRGKGWVLLYAWLIVLLVAARLTEPWAELKLWMEEGTEDL